MVASGGFARRGGSILSLFAHFLTFVLFWEVSMFIFYVKKRGMLWMGVFLLALFAIGVHLTFGIDFWGADLLGKGRKL